LKMLVHSFPIPNHIPALSSHTVRMYFTLRATRTANSLHNLALAS
jgi:hypothetical protein